MIGQPNKGFNAFHIKSRRHGFHFIEDLDIPDRIKEFKSNENVMCIYADKCQALLDRTGSCKDVLCNEDRCEVYDFCKSNRYVSQIDKAARAALILYSWMQLPTDPGSAGIYAQILNRRKKYARGALLSVVGEIDASKLLNRHFVSVDEIQKGISIWKDEPAGELYRMLGEMCVPHWTARQRWDRLVKEYPKLQHTDVIRQLSKYPLMNLTTNTIQELSLSKALSEKAISIDNVSEIARIPRIYPKDWTLVQRLEQFLMYCANPEPPIIFTGQGLEFVTPPVLHPLCDTYVMQSATADTQQLKTLITMTNNDISYHTAEGDRVAHHPDAKIFKIATGRYVRGTCFHHDKEWNVTGLRETIYPHLENLLNLLLNTPGQKFINTYKAIYDSDALEDDPLIKELRDLPVFSGQIGQEATAWIWTLIPSLLNLGQMNRARNC